MNEKNPGSHISPERMDCFIWQETSYEKSR